MFTFTNLARFTYEKKFIDADKWTSFFEMSRVHRSFNEALPIIFSVNDNYLLMDF